MKLVKALEAGGGLSLMISSSGFIYSNSLGFGYFTFAIVLHILGVITFAHGLTTEKPETQNGD